MTLELIWIIFIFAFGCCIGSFLNVVIYRLPRDKSLVTPRSACPKCDMPISFYDNIPLVSWLVLCGKCRNCKAPISLRYILIELFTGLFFVGVFLAYFSVGYRHFEIDQAVGLTAFAKGGWLFFVLQMILIAAFIAASAIDLELWIIPLSICWFVTAAGLIVSTFGVYIIDPGDIRTYELFPTASAATAILAIGAGLGLIISLLFLKFGIIKRSYEEPEGQPEDPQEEPDYNHRLEVLKEVVFLLPIAICSILAFVLYNKIPAFNDWWINMSQVPALTGFTGSLWGYFIGCGTVWLTRILGTLLFGKEAMGLGDVHLMGAAGAVTGAFFVVIAFFVAPFFGLGWAIFQMFFKKTRQIPYGPFLSLAVFAVMIFHDQIRDYWSSMVLYRY